MAKRLSEKAVARLAVRAKSYVIYDELQTGLGIRVTPSGRKIWRMQLRYPGASGQSKRTIGTYPALGVSAAREKAAAWYALVKQGIDPRTHEEEQRQVREKERAARALRDRNTFASYAEHYIASKTNRRAEADAAEIRRMLVPALGNKPLGQITPRDVRELFARLVAHAPFDARNAWGHATGIFKSAVHDELLVASPCASLDKGLVFRNAKLAARQHVLTDAELTSFWRASGELSDPYNQFFRLLALTGVRVGELTGAQWGELHPELRKLLRAQNSDWQAVPANVKTWTVPRSRFKSDVEHVVPLSNAALEILASLPLWSGGYIFTTTGGAKPINGLSKAKGRLDQEMLRHLETMAQERGEDPDEVTLPPFINHDLRRVVRTHLSALKVEDHVAEMVLGHARKGLQRIYDQHRYEPEIADALERWAERLRAIVAPQAPGSPKNVVKFPTAVA